MSKLGVNHHPPSQCRAGKKYLSEHDAREAAAFYFKHNGVYQIPYRCPFCNLWHLITDV